MIRKLQHSVTALAATAAVFGLLLLAGAPQPLAVPMPGTGELVAAETADTPPIDAAETKEGTRRHLRRARIGLALPYFSFAQGLRTVTGS